MKGGRVDLSYINMRLVRIRMLINECMGLLDPLYREDIEELDEEHKMLIDGHSYLIDQTMEEIAKKVRKLVKDPAGHRTSFYGSEFHKIIKRLQKVYLRLYEEMYGGYTFYDVDMGIQPYVRAFHQHVNRMHITEHIEL